MSARSIVLLHPVSRLYAQSYPQLASGIVIDNRSRWLVETRSNIHIRPCLSRQRASRHSLMEEPVKMTFSTLRIKSRLDDAQLGSRPVDDMDSKDLLVRCERSRVMTTQEKDG